MHQIPEHGKCFVCGAENPHSIGIRWMAHDDGSLSGEVTLTDSQQGPPGLAHGGATAALLDEAMGLAVWMAGLRVASVNLNVDYLGPVPLGEKVGVRARIDGKSEKAIRTSGEITLTGGEVAVSATGVYVEAGHLFTRVEFKRTEG